MLAGLALAAALATSPNATDLIVRFEITSPAHYERRLTGIACPGAASGPTIGIGYDLGHQSASAIREDWRLSPHAEALTLGTGAMGDAACKAARDRIGPVRIPFELAKAVFYRSTLPEYAARADRYIGRGQLRALPPDAAGSVTATVYNRGHATIGPSRAEMRALRDDCIPRRDTACMAEQYRSMTRLWRGTRIEAGMTARYDATARLALGQWRLAQ